MSARWVALVVLLGAIAPARASTVIELSPEALAADAERIVDATVLTRVTTWDAAHTGFETHALLAIETTRKGPSAPWVEVVVPGGELDGARQIIVGMPAVAIGERARWFLRDRGDGRFRIYGWAQGKWPARTVHGVTTFAPAPLAAERDTTIAMFTTNGMVWPAAAMPVPYLVQTTGSADLTLPDEIAAIDAAFATWQAVPTASLTFQNAGMTNLGMAVDGTNVILFLETGWLYGSEAAAATSLFIVDGQQTADIGVNGQNFRWAIGPPGSAIGSKVLDLQAVLTHEIGHFSGLDHTMRAYDTMYFAWRPWPGQRTLSIDDKLGLSSIYPIAGDECASATCPADETCTPHPLGNLCEGVPDPVGAPCNYDRVECDAFCLFTATNLSTGYCSKSCVTNADCPLTHHCDNAMAGTTTVKVCFVGAQPPPPPPCAVDEDCPTGRHCDAVNGACTFDCRSSADCQAGSTCDDRGSCVATGGGCRTAGEPGMFGVLVVGFALGRRRRWRSTGRPR